MKKKFLSVLISIILILGLIISVGADGNFTNPPQDSTQTTLIQEENQNNLSEIPENVEYVPLEQITEEDFIKEIEKNESIKNNSIVLKENKIKESPFLSENESNGTGQKVIYKISNESLNETGQEEVINNSPDLSGENSEIHTDVRGNIPLETGADSSSASVSSSFEDNYVNLNEINNLNSSQNETEQENQENLEKTIYNYYNEGKKVIEIKTYKRIEIQKQEIEKSELEKQIILSSEEHVEDPLRVYVDLKKEAEKQEIKIYWENKNLEITSLEEFEVEYYDEDNNGLIERVSWMVPHLSEQIFSVVINFERTSESLDQLLLTVNGPPEGEEVNNPIIFNVSVNYSGNVNCYLKVNNSIPQEFSGNLSNYSLILPNGTYDWLVNCSDTSNPSINDSDSGNFIINEGFSVSNPDKVYLLNQNNYLVGNIGLIQINSQKNSNIEIVVDRPSPYVAHTINVFGTTYTLVLNETLLLGPGEYKIKANFKEPSANYSVEKNFSVAKAELIFNEGEYGVGETIEIRVNINSPVEKISFYGLNLGDGRMDYNSTLLTNQLNNISYKSYNSIGNYSLKLDTIIDGKTFTIQKNGITVINRGDNSPPEIKLIYPEDDAIINNDTITFEYSAEDNIKLQNCTFRLYNVSGSSGSIYSANEITGVSAINTTLKNNEKVKIILEKFDERWYAWEVECLDNSSNDNYKINWFEVRYPNSTNSASLTSNSNSDSDYNHKDEIENTMIKVNEFLINENNLSIKEGEALESMGILTDIEYYKKRLVQIDQYFKENYKYVSNENLREQKNKEYLEEFENIKNNIPLNVKVLDDYEYVKNSIDTNLEGVVSDYLKSTNTLASKRVIKNLAKMNLNLQQEISVSVKVKEIRIEYENSTKQIILVVKRIDLKDEKYNQILEVIPKEIAENVDEVTFLVEKQVIKEDPLVKILYEDLNENNELVYYIEKNLDIKKISKTETILFEDSFQVKAGVTGLFALNIPNGNPIYFALALLLVICVIILLLFALRKLRKQHWKREPNVAKVFDLIGQINRYISEKDLERTREGYHELKKIYPVLPEKTKCYFYKRISEILIEIDKRDIFGLVREYEEAKRHWNKEDCIRIYKDIKKVYERLPDKYRKKIYERITKY